MNWLQFTDKNPVLFTLLSEVQHSAWHMVCANKIAVDLLTEQEKKKKKQESRGKQRDY